MTGQKSLTLTLQQRSVSIQHQNSPCGLETPFTASSDAIRPVDGLRLDFNLDFEQVFFSIIPSALFIALSTWRIFYQL